MIKPQTLHPLKATRQIRENYLRYLKTAFPIQDSQLRNDYWRALEEPGLLVKGPLLEATPEFEKGRSIRQLIDADVLHTGFTQLCSSALPLDRPLYLHQDQAVEKLCRDRRNLVVTTGTGSGKTEAFLIPIFNSLLREEELGSLNSRGVRALMLYPMNALANDQLKRLRKVLKGHKGITFGRYIGDTAQNDRDALQKFYDQFPGEEPLENELLSRDAMQALPPHILLTNYAMLEYLLLRPADNVFFDGPTAKHWKFIVLDEAHVYNGAIGIEIAMLLRRLKDRVIQSKKGKLQIIATSATLGRGEQDFPEVVDFASNLFGESFEWDPLNPGKQDVVKSTRVEARPVEVCWDEISSAFFMELGNVLSLEDRENSLQECVKVCEKNLVPKNILEHGLQMAQEGNECSEQIFLYHLLRGNNRLQKLQMLLAKEPRFLTDIAQELFADTKEAEEALIALVNLAVRARPGPENVSLLPARYHVFSRALEGSFVCLNHVEHSSLEHGRVYLTRHERCPECGSPTWELLACVRCGAIYLWGKVREENGANQFVCYTPESFSEASGEVHCFRVGGAATVVDEDEVEDDSVIEKQGDYWNLCARCGEIREAKDALSCACGSKAVTLSLTEVDPPIDGRLPKCISCGTRNNQGAVYRFLTGQDAPVSVLATSLYQALPEADDKIMQDLPGKGRKLLVFSDSRQDAAFFAPYLERTYSQLLRRHLITQTLFEDEDAREGHLRLKDLVRRLRSKTEAAGFFLPTDSYDYRTDQIFKWLMQEFVALDRRNSLEGTGLIQFRLIKPPKWMAPEILRGDPWNMTEDEAWWFIEALFESIRLQGCITFPPNVDPRDEVFSPRNQIYTINEYESNRFDHVISWLPKSGSNRRLDFAMKVIERVSPGFDQNQKRTLATEVLKGIWRMITTDRAWRYHMQSERASGKNVVFKANHEMWEILPIDPDGGELFICSQCRTITSRNLRGVCQTFSCNGTLEVLDRAVPEWKDNHYRKLYQEILPIPLSAEEHTAQWSAEAALKKQQSFVNGEVNILSCSTTFELGVDVGELQAVLMRNMPPTTANYVQRAGRAGRRTDSAAFSLTFAQRRSHDLMYYSDPVKMVSGLIRPPVISLQNEKIIRRHLHSILFAGFLRWAQDQNCSYSNIGEFFLPGQGKSGADLLRQYLDTRPQQIAEAMQRVIPEEVADQFDLTGWGWINNLTNLGSTNDDHEEPTLDKAEAEVQGNIQEIESAIAEEIQSDHKYKYKNADRLRMTGDTVKHRNLLGYLGTHNVLPKYGFPTDVVELRTNHINIPEAKQVELQRDLRIAIAEYAPGGEVVAAKKLWVSGGVYKPPSKHWQTFYYAICSGCKRFYYSMNKLESTCPNCHGNLFSSWPRKTYGTLIEPEFGFIAKNEEPKTPGERRPNRSYASTVHFGEYRIPGKETRLDPILEVDEHFTSDLLHLTKQYSRFGWLVVINAGNRGDGFRICDNCGSSNPDKPNSSKKKGKPDPHKNPITGRDCSGTMNTYSLGHRFMTDILELRFEGHLAATVEDDTWRSILYALLEGASAAIGIRREDMDGTLHYHEGSNIPSLMLYDDVPGGAGHVKRIERHMDEVVQAAWERMNHECCGPETSCYECLRNYRNQPYHDHLKRGLAEAFLQSLRDAQKV